MKTTILPTTTPKNRTEPKFEFARGVTGQLLNCGSMNRPPWRRAFVLIGLILIGFALAPQARATCQEGCLTNDNTVLGDDALISLTTGSLNTAVGVQALLSNTTGSENTATGVNALLSNTTGFDNTAIGISALINNDTGSSNVAIGAHAMEFNTTGSENTATGQGALFSNTTGFDNTATGLNALLSNTEGSGNLAVGSVALRDLTSGDSNVAVGNAALVQGVTVNFNTALGRRALFRSQGDQNVGLGFFAGSNLNDGGTNNIYVGNVGPVPIGSESNTIRIGTQTATTATIGNPPVETHPMPAHTATFIAGISGAAITGRPVMINGNGRLGTAPCSARYKDEIKPMDAASEVILALKPVTFRYKKEIDADRTPQFGLIAEDVEKVNPNLVARDEQGKPYTVRYEAVNAMLLNEFLKEHRRVEQLEKQVAALTAGLQKVSAQLELSKTAPQTVLNNQ
jgi:hypothetical protein